MVARPGSIQYNWNAGELDPAAAGRADIKQYYSGAKYMRNTEPRPQGGFRLLPRTRDCGDVRANLIVQVGTYTPTLGPHSAAATIATMTYATPQAIAAVDITDLSANVALTDAVRVEYFDGAAWQAIAAALDVAVTARRRRVGFAPGTTVTTQQVRIRLILTPPSATTFVLGGMSVLIEGAAATVAREFAISISNEEAFMGVVTPGHIDIWKSGVYSGCAYLPYTGAQITGLTRTARLETLLLWHPDVATQRIRRQGGDHEWAVDDAPWVNTAEVDYGGIYPITTDEWTLTVTSNAAPTGGLISMTVNGEDTTSVEIAGSWTGFAADLKAAIEALPSVGPGVNVTVIGTPTVTLAKWKIEFAGTDNEGTRYSVSAQLNPTTFTGAATMAHTRFGDKGGEAIISPARGYASCGVFFEDRLWQGAFKSKPGALLGSVNGEYFDLNIELQNPAGAVLLNLDQDGADKILHMTAGRFMAIFTSAAEYYISSRPVSRQATVNVVQSTRNGCAPTIAPVEQEMSLLYVGRSRNIIYAATYSDVSQVFESEPISLLASHLVAGVKAAALQKTNSATVANRYWMARDNGTVSVAVLIRGQEVAAFVRWETDGAVQDVAVDGQNIAYMIVQRTIAGQPRLIFERGEESLWVDQARDVAVIEGQQVITGLSRFEGATVWAVVDGYVDGPHLVTGGTITLGYATKAAGTITVGRWTPPSVKPLPPPRLVAERTQLKRPMRIHTVRGEADGCTSLAIAANGGQPQDVAFVQFGDLADQPVPPVFGPFTVSGLRGWSAEGDVEITQIRPGAFDVRDVTVESKT